MEVCRPSIVPIVERFRCPGETYDIDRAVHLARLAAWYPACRECEHRQATYSLDSARVQAISRLVGPAPAALQLSAEAIAIVGEQHTAVAAIRSIVTALTTIVWRDAKGLRRAPRLIMGTDGSAEAATLMAEACSAIVRSGCEAIEAGATTSASLVAQSIQLGVEAAVRICRGEEQVQSFDVKAWGRAGQPWSSPGSLNSLYQLCRESLARPKRSGGSVIRAGSDDVYLRSLASMYHALRPLRFAIDSKSPCLLTFLRRLTADSACQNFAAKPSGNLTRDRTDRSTGVERRLRRLSGQVLADGLHFAVYVDGDAEHCQLIDDLGRVVSTESLALLHARFVLAQQRSATVVLSRTADASLESRLIDLQAKVVCAADTREDMFHAMTASQALFGCDSAGRMWYSGEPSAPDALSTLSLLLAILSQSDRSMSEVLDAA